MDLGITGRRAIACAASKGLGNCAIALVGEGVAITTPEGREAALATCPDPDILVNNSGGLAALGGAEVLGREPIEIAFRNKTMMVHPMHMRGLPFQVVEIDGDHWGRRKVQPHSQGADHPWPA